VKVHNMTSRGKRTNWAAALAAVAFCTGMAAPLAAKEMPRDRHAGYYYPKKFSVERYVARSQVLIGASRKQRIAFVTNLTGAMLSRDRLPPFAIFAKGKDAEKLIIVGMGDWVGTIYQARALLAMMTAQARQTPALRAYKVEDVFTFFDFANMLGFTRITISDGKSFAHQIRIVQDE
jgi:hypothetical protein